MEISGTPVFKRIYNVNKRIVCLRGGTRSSKSYSLMQVAVLWLWSGHIGGRDVLEGNFSICRSTMPALKATVLKDFTDYLHQLDIYKFIDHRKTTHEFKYRGRMITFFSLDDEHKLRGRQHSFIWINECNDTAFEIFNQAIMRTEHTVFLDYNPTGSPWVRTEIEDKRLPERGDVHLDVSVYTDNPFLREGMINEILGLKHVDKDLYNVYTRGIWVDLRGLIFKEVTIVQSIPEGRVFYGLDFGYIHATVLMKVTILNNNIYLEELIHRSKLLINEIAVKITALGITSKVFCDAAEPRSIEELKRRGVNVRTAKKGPDSVMQGLTYIKQHRIHIHENSIHTIEQFKRYKWKEDKDGNMMDEPIKLFDDSSDATRYALSRSLGRKLKFL